MKKIIFPTLLSILTICFFVSNSMSMSNLHSIDKLKITSDEIPAGFQIGKIPDFAKNVLKNNPWTLDNYAISKLAHRIYPGGDKKNINQVHMTIIANNKNPFGDDIVCYIFLFSDNRTAKIEMTKLRDFVKYNSDRSIVLEKDAVGVYLMVDRVQDYPLIEKISMNIKKRMDTL